MQPSTGQCASHSGEPAQLEQFSSITASRAVPLRFFASAIRLHPRFLQPCPERERYRDREQYPPVSDEPYSAPIQPINEIGRVGIEPRENLLSFGVVPFFLQHQRHSLQGSLILWIDFQSWLKVTSCLPPIFLLRIDPTSIVKRCPELTIEFQRFVQANDSFLQVASSFLCSGEIGIGFRQVRSDLDHAAVLFERGIRIATHLQLNPG